MAKKDKPLVLVDGSSYLYRAYFAPAGNNMHNSKGQPTGAIKIFTSMIKKLQKDYADSPVAVVFDAKGKTFRDDIYPEYKATRPPMPDDLREQIEPIHQIVKAMGLPLIVVPGVEADDVIGTLCQRATQEKRPVVVSTGDKDMAQLVNDNVCLVDTMKNRVMDVKGVEEKFGIPPELIIDFLALMGDSSDNIPGVPGVGEKTALALLQGLGGLNKIYNNLDKVKDLSFRGAKNMAEKLEASKDKADLSYQLATIKLDVDLDFKFEDLKQQEPDTSSLMKLFMELEFKAWVSELSEKGEEVEVKADDVEKNYHIITEEKQLDEWIKNLQNAELFAFDTETTSLEYMVAELVGVSVCCKPGEAAYIPCGHDYLGAPEQISRSALLAKLKPLLENPNKLKVGQNLKYDAHILKNYDINLAGIAHDTMLESYVYNSTASRHDMDSLALAYLGLKTVHFEDIAGKGAKQITFNQIDLEKAGYYAAEDADITLRLHEKIWPKIEKEAGLKNIYENIEIPLVSVLEKMERRGTIIDPFILQAQTNEHQVTIAELQRQAYEIAGEEFNLASPKQLGRILFEKQKLPVLKKTKTGAISTAEEILQELALDYPLPKVILEHRGLAKLVSTYTEKLPQLVNPKTGRVHTSYQQAIASTGRLSSTDPNLQNIPIKTEAGRKVRQAFIAPKGYKIVAADYSQIELRIMAHLSGDKGLQTAFANNLDVHKATAAEVFDTELDKVSAEQRRSAKAINFGLIYGMSAFGLAKQLHIGRNDAQRYIDRYFSRYPGVADYMSNIRNTAAEQGYVETLFGRRLYLPDITSNNAIRRKAAERVAINAPMQGSAADIIKLAMIKVDKWIEEEAVDAFLVMQVHDELVLEVAESKVDEISQHLCAMMSEAANLSVPLLVEAGSGNSWEEAH